MNINLFELYKSFDKILFIHVNSPIAFLKPINNEEFNMSIPDGATTLQTGSYLSSVTALATSAVSTITSTVKSCFNSAINGMTFVAGGTCAAVKKGITFTATLCAANPKTTKVALAAVALVGAAYAGRSYYPTLKSMISK